MMHGPKSDLPITTWVVHHAHTSIQITTTECDGVLRLAVHIMTNSPTDGQKQPGEAFIDTTAVGYKIKRAHLYNMMHTRTMYLCCVVTCRAFPRVVPIALRYVDYTKNTPPTYRHELHRSILWRLHIHTKRKRRLHTYTKPSVMRYRASSHPDTCRDSSTWSTGYQEAPVRKEKLIFILKR